MIPILLRLSGFLSYRAPAEIDFTSFDLACISGPNGAGKSSLLDAITWALFGQARKRDDAIVNLQSQTAEVALTFEYEGNIYRVLRSQPRGKTASLEFQIRDGEKWRPLTERTLRETQARIEETLRLDYETFVNAAFFLQGKADQFAQQPPARRKEILSNILGLEVWEEYRQRAAERRKESEKELALLEERLAEITAELNEEPERRRHLEELEARLKQLRAARQVQATTLENMRAVIAALEQQRALVQTLANSRQGLQEKLARQRERLTGQQEKRAQLGQILARAEEIQAAYATWQQARQEVERWEHLARQYHACLARREPYQQTLIREQARLEEEKAALEEQAQRIAQQQIECVRLQQEIEGRQRELAQIEQSLLQRADLEAQLQAARQKEAELRTENARLKTEMEELKERIDRLRAAAGATCPLCGQTLAPEERASLLERLTAEGTAKGDTWRANKATLQELATRIADLESERKVLTALEQQQRELERLLAQQTERLETLQRQQTEWETSGAPRLQEVTRQLNEKDFAHEARQALATIERELATLHYDPQAHEVARQRENELRTAEAAHRQLETARAETRLLDDEITSLQAEIAALESELEKTSQEWETARQNLLAAEAQAPDIAAAERALTDSQEEEHRLNQEVGAARQRVAVLEELRVRKKSLESERESLARRIGQYKTLERAFGKDGVPALLIEQALPEIETRANELLDRLSDGQMSVRFLTQMAYKDKSRDDLRETLEIQISDGAGVRAYELYSGGEAFRVNFAIRVALAELLARRKGARLQTLIIDEGFGSQDSQGRQRIIEAINSIRQDFRKILVITHLDDLKDAFPARIEVEKTAEGSQARLA